MQLFILLCAVVGSFAAQNVKVWGSSSDVCELSLETGPCDALFHRYGFDKVSGECKKFVYGGCGGNKNNFRTLEACQRACKATAVCGENEEYLECGTACPLTCDNYANSPKMCPAVCKTGCQCKKGFVLTKDNRCVLPEKCPSKSDEVKSCLAKADGGMCRGYFPMFYYDAKSGSCKEFIYGGCGGNGNRYSSEEECLNHCGDVKVWESSSDVCELPLETGPCYALFHRYGFDKASGECKKFVYGGCGGNKNNFRTLEACQSECTASARGHALDRPDCDKPPETGLCQAIFHRYYYDQEEGMCKKFIYGGCDGNRNNFKSEFECYNKCGALLSGGARACQQEKEVGSCKAAFSRFYFNKESRKCENFIYGGCDGNDNNFETQKDCEDVCVV